MTSAGYPAPACSTEHHAAGQPFHEGEEPKPRPKIWMQLSASQVRRVKIVDSALSTLFRNVPIVNLLEMSPFAVDVEQNIAVALYEQG
jgi:hypothetical protein